MRFPVTHRAYQHRPKQDPFPRTSRGAPTAVGNPQGMFAARKLPDLGASVALQQLLCSCSCGNHARNRQARPRGSAPAPCWFTQGVLVWFKPAHASRHTAIGEEQGRTERACPLSPANTAAAHSHLPVRYTNNKRKCGRCQPNVQLDVTESRSVYGYGPG
jgi:hypothetical protein